MPTGSALPRGAGTARGEVWSVAAHRSSAPRPAPGQRERHRHGLRLARPPAEGEREAAATGFSRHHLERLLGVADGHADREPPAIAGPLPTEGARGRVERIREGWPCRADDEPFAAGLPRHEVARVGEAEIGLVGPRRVAGERFRAVGQGLGRRVSHEPERALHDERAGETGDGRTITPHRMPLHDPAKRKKVASMVADEHGNGISRRAIFGASRQRIFPVVSTSAGSFPEVFSTPVPTW